MQIVKLCNKLDLIKEIFDKRSNDDYFTGHDWLRMETIQFFDDLCENIYSSGWYSPFIKKDDCTAWHVDGGGKGGYSMIISSYPNPTEILEYPHELFDYFCNSQHELKKHQVDHLLKSGQAKLITPEPGDIYYLGPGVIHRTNPKAYGQKHLVMRIWNPILTPKYAKMVESEKLCPNT